MIELPEAAVLAQQINETAKGKRIMNVTAAQSPHKFAWYHKDPQKYQELLTGKAVEEAEGHGGMVEIKADGAVILFGDGVNIRFLSENEKHPAKHQLLIEFDDFTAICASVQMYGGLWCFKDGDFENKYFQLSKEKPLSPDTAENRINDGSCYDCT